MQQTFSVNKEPRVLIENLSGDLRVSPRDAGSINLMTDGHIGELYQEGDAIVILNCEDDLALQVPSDTEIRATNVHGDVAVQLARRVELHNVAGDTVLERIGQGVDIETIGEAIAVYHISGDLVVRDSSSLRSREDIEGDASIANVALVEIERINGDMSLQHCETAVIGDVDGDFSASGFEDALSCGNISGDCSVSGGGRGDCTLGNVGGDLAIAGVSTVHVGSVGGDCNVRDVSGGIEFGNIGGDTNFQNIFEHTHIGNIGGDASIKDLQGTIDAGNIGGDLLLDATYPAGSTTRLRVGGDAVVRLPTPADLALQAFVGGDVSGAPMAPGGNQVNLVYGSGSARLELYVGGDLTVRGGGKPSGSSYGEAGSEGNWSNWQSDFERDMAELGREMSKLGQELSREITNAFKDAGWQKGSEWSTAFTNKMEEQIHRAHRKAEEQARKAEERARKAHEQASRMRVRLNEREWQLDPARLERIKEQATRAANEGIAGALDAVERAIQNLRIPQPPRPPTPPRSPSPPVVPVPPVEPVPPVPPTYTQQPTGQEPAPAQSSTTSEDAEEPNLDQEREAILRMIAEGRISPEEGDMLLEGLGG
jgi:hypothetical protein